MISSSISTIYLAVCLVHGICMYILYNPFQLGPSLYRWQLFMRITVSAHSYPDAEAETPILWPPNVKNWLIWKDPDAAKDWRWEEKGMAEDEMVGWHHWLNGHEFKLTPRVGDGQGGLAYCSIHGVAKSQTLLSNWTTIGKNDYSLKF